MCCASVLFVTVAVCFIISKLFRSRNSSADGKPLPGPKSYPIIGNALDVDFHRLYLSAYDLANNFGPIFQIRLLGKTVVFINDVELERKAFGSKDYGNTFNNRPGAFWGKYVNVDDIALSNTSKKTMAKRKLLHRSLHFYGEGIKHFEEKAGEVFQRYLEELKATGQRDFDMNDLIKKSFANMLVTLMTGDSSEAVDSDKVWQWVDSSNHYLSGMAFVYDFLPLIRFIPGSLGNTYREAMASRDFLLDISYFTIKKSVDNQTEGEQQGLVKNLIKLQPELNQQEGRELVTDNDVKGIILDTFAAAIDTTSAVLINAFGILLTYSDVAKRIQNEIEEVVGSDRKPRSSDKHNMPYTMATVYEILRYTSSAAPLPIPHQASRDINFEGFFIAKDTVLLANHWFIHHDPKFWKEPWCFNPERFLDDDGKLLPPEHETRRHLVPFSTGNRKCIGRNFGTAMLFLYLVTVLQSFDIAPPSDGQLPETDPRSYSPGIDLRVKRHLCRAVTRLHNPCT